MWNSSGHRLEMEDGKETRWKTKIIDTSKVDEKLRITRETKITVWIFRIRLMEKHTKKLQDRHRDGVLKFMEGNKTEYCAELRIYLQKTCHRQCLRMIITKNSLLLPRHICPYQSAKLENTNTKKKENLTKLKALARKLQAWVEITLMPPYMEMSKGHLKVLRNWIR